MGEGLCLCGMIRWANMKSNCQIIVILINIERHGLVFKLYDKFSVHSTKRLKKTSGSYTTYWTIQILYAEINFSGSPRYFSKSWPPQKSDPHYVTVAEGWLRIGISNNMVHCSNWNVIKSIYRNLMLNFKRLFLILLVNEDINCC